LGLVALVLLGSQPPISIFDLWLIVTVWAWMFDVALDRFSISHGTMFSNCAVVNVNRNCGTGCGPRGSSLNSLTSTPNVAAIVSRSRSARGRVSAF
jgi:hypothetical protein